MKVAQASRLWAVTQDLLAHLGTPARRRYHYWVAAKRDFGYTVSL